MKTIKIISVIALFLMAFQSYAQDAEKAKALADELGVFL